MVQEYLSERTIVAEADGRDIEFAVNSGVPQGSILGPTLWNFQYDGVLRLELPPGVTLIGFADDLAMVATSKTEEELIQKVDLALEDIRQWLIIRKLSLAPEKTEAIVMAGRRKLSRITFKIDGTEITPVSKLKYLGVWLDSKRNFRPHVRETVQKVERTCGALNGLMPNVRGPRQEKRKMLAAVATSVVLYGAPVWARAIQAVTYRRMLLRIQRRLALRVCSAYRTVSTEAVFVIAGTPPWDLLIEEREEIHRGTSKVEARLQLMLKWQRRWTAAETGAWTRRFIPEIDVWLNRSHGEVNHELTQLISGHGRFGAYLTRFRLREVSGCRLCGTEAQEDAEHLFSRCSSLRTERVETAVLLNIGEAEWAPQSVATAMLSDGRKWDAVSDFAKGVIRRLQRAEEDVP